MKAFVTKGIVLNRTNFSEADRIVTLLTPDQGKIRVLARGVRKPKSKMAGGIELFSTVDLTVLPGKSDISTLMSARMRTHFAEIVKDIQRTMFGYETLKRFNKLTHDSVEEGYFNLLITTLEALNDHDTPLELTDLWLNLRLLYLSGHAPNLNTDVNGNKLDATQQYDFSFENMAFGPRRGGSANAKHIKVLRLGTSVETPKLLTKIAEIDELLEGTLQLSRNMARTHLPL